MRHDRAERPLPQFQNPKLPVRPARREPPTPWSHFRPRPTVDLSGELPTAVLRELEIGDEQ
jgi:hypothetical protein